MTDAILIRRAEPSDYPAVHRIHASEAVYSATLQLPYGSPEL
jgi:hypothetical protein